MAGLPIELEYTERLCYYVHGVRIENTPLPCLPAQANRAGRKTNAAPTFSYESSVSPISMVFACQRTLFLSHLEANTLVVARGKYPM